MALKSFVPDTAPAAAPLVVLLHGDNGGDMRNSAYLGIARQLSEHLKAPTVFMLRPGYRAEFGKSDGPTAFRDDDYTRENVAALAGAVGSLRAHYGNRRVVLVGHSGGAAMSALLLAHHPEVVDAIVLAACPCEVPRWRIWRQRTANRSGYWPNSLSPIDFAGQVKHDAVVIALTGTQDENTPPEFAEPYVTALLAAGVRRARFVPVPEATHRSIRSSRQLLDAVVDAVASLRE